MLIKERALGYAMIIMVVLEFVFGLNQLASVSKMLYNCKEMKE